MKVSAYGEHTELVVEGVIWQAGQSAADLGIPGEDKLASDSSRQLQTRR